MIRIITDSASDFPETLIREYDIIMMRMQIQFGKESFQDGIEMSKKAFYDRLRTSEELPVTSQITPDTFLQVFQPIVEAGDDIIGIFLSSQLSGTLQSAQIAAEMAGSDHIHIVDSQNVSFGEALLVWEAARLRETGRSAREIADALLLFRERIRVYASVETLTYLRKGGRLSAASAFVGGILGVTPVVSITEGKVEAIGKTRGQKAAFAYMRQKWEERPADAQYPVFFGHTDAPEALDKFKTLFSVQDSMDISIGSTVGTHAGPGAVGIAYVERESEV